MGFSLRFTRWNQVSTLALDTSMPSTLSGEMGVMGAISFRHGYATLRGSGGSHRGDQPCRYRRVPLQEGGLRYCSICAVAESTARSHLRHWLDALGQGQISRAAASSSQE